MTRYVVALFPGRASAEQAIVHLIDAGFDSKDIGFVSQDKRETVEVREDHGTATQSTQSAIGGGIVGGTAGGLLAATGALVVPGIGPLISAGILATALVGEAMGWLAGGLVGLGLTKETADYYEGRVQQGGTLVTVVANGREVEARDILSRDGAQDLHTQE